MNRIVFLPRAVAEKWQPAPGSALISIHDRSEPPMQPKAGWAETLYLRFHDTDGQSMGLETFSSAQAQEVLHFGIKHKDAPELVAHCSLGQSRSAAIALFLAEHLGVLCFKEQRQVSASTWPSYNRKVYLTLFEELYGPMGSAFQALEP